MSGWGAIYNNTRFSMSMLSETLARLQEQATTGARVLRASDDPSDAYQILHLKYQSGDLANYMKNLDNVVVNLEGASNSLQAVSSSLSRVGELLTQASSQTYGGSNRRAMSEEVNSLLEQMVSLANYQTLGRYVFGGADVTSAPYKVERTSGTITAVRYQGSADDLPVPVAPGVECSGLLVGEQVFRSNDRQAPQFLGQTGAAAGTATSTVRGDVWMTAVNTATAYDDGGAGSGVAAGTGSARDTILGEHTLTVNSAARTMRLDDGSAVHFTDETDLELTNVAGDKVHVNVAAYDGVFDGAVTLTGTGTLSIDDGASTTALDAAALAEHNLKLTDSRTGRILYVDATGIARSGLEPIRVPGTYDLFGTLIEIRDLLRNSRGLPENKQIDMLQEAGGALQEATAAIQLQMTSVGGRLGAMDSLRQSLDDMKTNADTQKAKLQNADVVQLSVDLARTQMLYQMSLSVAAKLLNLSLLDFID